MQTEMQDCCAGALPVPPSYAECRVEEKIVRADCVASPLALAALFAWDEDEDF
jgi:hypothetical protein